MNKLLPKETAIVNATLYIEEVDKKYGYVPDYATKDASERFGLTMDECYAIRDIIQSGK